MSDRAPCEEVARCSFLVLGEDSAEDAFETLCAVSRKVLRLVDPFYDDQRVRLEPPAPLARPGLRGNLWKSKNPKDYRARVDLIGYLATKLLEGDTSFVIFHIDGDRPFSEKEHSENVRKFRDFIETDVRQHVDYRRQQKGLPPLGELSLSQLLLMVPFYSIEAWLFQNTLTGRRLCRENVDCKHKGCASLFDAWEKDRALLDEVVKPKEQICFKGRYNHQLAGGLDADTVYYAGKSLHDIVNDFMRRDVLRRALERARPT